MTPTSPPTRVASAPGDACASAANAGRYAATERATTLYEASAPRVVIVLPAYNEQQSLGQLLDGIGVALIGLNNPYEVVVVDDGSQDGTGMVASQASFRLPLSLVTHKRNSGLAAALRTGIEAAVAKTRPGDVICTMDADNTHPPGLLPRMLAMLGEGCDVVIASRFRAGSRVVGVPMLRAWLSVASRLLFSLVLPIRGVRDYTCGYRAYRAAVLHDALAEHGDRFVTERGFSCMVDVLLKLRGRGLVVGEAPLVLRYDRKGGVSKMRVSKTVWDTLSLIVRRRLRG